MRSPAGEKGQYKYNFVLNFNSGKAHLLPFCPEDPFARKLYDGFSPVMLAFLIKQPQDLLILFAGTGKDMIEAYSYSNGQAHITGVELNPLMVRKALEMPEFHLKEFFDKGNVQMVVQEGRSFFEQSSQTYDAIILSWSGATPANYMGVSSYTGQYLYTKEAMKAYLRKLNPGGVVGLVHGSSRLLATIKAAFEDLGYPDAQQHIVEMVKRSVLETGSDQKDIWDPFQARDFLIKNTPFTAEQMSAMSPSISEMGLEVVLSPFYVHPRYAIDRLILRHPDIEKLMNDLSKKNAMDLTLMTDDKPYIYNQFRFNGINLKGLREVWAGKSLLSVLSEYSLQEVMFAFIFIFISGSFLLIMAPLFWIKRFSVTFADAKWLAYFALLGLGYMFAEISILQRFTFFLGNPVYAFSVVLAGLLVSSGIGSASSSLLFRENVLSIPKAAVLVTGVLILYYLILDKIIAACLGSPFFGRLGLSVLFIFPLGWLLGMLFPQGLKKINTQRPHLIPWAWAFNGYMSIVGSLISIYLCFVTGINAYFLIAAGLYFALVFLKIK